MATKAPLVDRFGLIGTTLDQKFRVERLVAEGGFAVVYQARHVMLDRPVALKILKPPPEMPAEARARFVEGFAQEARSIIQINHPNIVQVLDFGVAAFGDGERSAWMALEWLEGPTLREELLARRGRGGRSPAEVLALARPVLDALAYAHDAGIAHRDVKPANIMLVASRRGTTLKLLDFGIAKLMEDGEDIGTEQTKTRSPFQAYSLHYAAPEQIGGTRTGPWTDVHALGLILTEMLTDARAYSGADRTEICCQILAAERPTPARHAVDVGPWQQVLERALAIRPGNRHRDAGELLDALEKALGVDAAVARAQVPAPLVQSAGVADDVNPTTLRSAVSSVAQRPSVAAPARGRRVGVWAAVGVAIVALALGAARLAGFPSRRPSAAAAVTVQVDPSLPAAVVIAPVAGSTAAPVAPPTVAPVAPVEAPHAAAAPVPPSDTVHSSAPAGHPASTAGHATTRHRAGAAGDHGAHGVDGNAHVEID